MFPTRRITMGGDKFRDEYSLAFDGSNDYVELSGAFNYNVHSISTWIKVTADTANDAIFDYRDANNDGIYLFIDDSERITYQLNNADGLYDTPLTGGVWYHIVATNDGSTSTIYLNGVSVETADTSGETISIAGTNPPRIGARSHTSPSNYFNGSISEVAIYNSALTASQVKTLYNGREPYNHKEGIASGSLQAWYRMGDGTLDSRSLRGLGPGHSDLQCITDMVTPTIGTSLWDAGADVFTSGTYNWSAYGSNTIENDSNTLKVTYVDNSNGAVVDLKSGHDLSSDLTVGKVYKIMFDTKVNTGSVSFHASSGSGSDDLTWTVTNTSFQTHEGYFLCGHATNCYFRCRDFGSGEIAWIDNLSLQEVGGNAGVMQNMDIGDFVGDTP